MARVEVPRHLREHVKAIRENVSSRPSPAEWAPHIAFLIEMGYTDAQINAAMGWDATGRNLRKIKRFAKLDGTGLVRVEPGQIPLDKLEPQFRAMMEDSADGFIAFYNYFNDKEMPAHCEEWVRAAFDEPLLLLNVPPRHNKSTVFSIWYPVWRIVRDRDTQVLIVSQTDTLSTRWVGYIASILASSDVPRVFGRFKPEKGDSEIPWRPSKGELMVLGREGSRAMQFSVLSRGSGSQILGFEADLIVADDVTTKKIAISPIQRESQILWFQEEVLSRGNPDARAIVIGQRVHLHDLYAYLRDLVWDHGPKKDEPLWYHVNYPAVSKWPVEEDGSDAEVLWPEVWPYERLMSRYALVGGKATFYTMYQQDPLAADATLVREEWLEACRDHERRHGTGIMPEGSDDGFLPIVRVASLDPSPTQYNGLVVADVVTTRDKFAAAIVDAYSFKTERQAELLAKINEVVARYHPTYFIFEKNIAQYWARGDPFIEELKLKCRVLEHTTTAVSKYDIETGLESLSFDFETGGIRLPYGDVEGAAASRLIEDEARNWTREGRLRDDVLMALWFIKFNWKRLRPLSGLPTTFRGFKQVEHGYRSRLRENQDLVKEFRKQRDRERLRRQQNAAS